MTEKEIAEIRRRFNIDKTNISNIRGCYVNENKEIISEFDQFFGTVQGKRLKKFLLSLKKLFPEHWVKILLILSFPISRLLTVTSISCL